LLIRKQATKEKEQNLLEINLLETRTETNINEQKEKLQELIVINNFIVIL
jgi:hypothetical protein